jgi:hypothetical protein
MILKVKNRYFIENLPDTLRGTFSLSIWTKLFSTKPAPFLKTYCIYLTLHLGISNNTEGVEYE